MGRELIGLNSGPTESDITASLLPNDTTALRNYTQQYTLDHLGNMLQVQHTATGGNWNRYYHYNIATNNHLLSTSSDNNQPTVDQYTYDPHGSMLSMPHLAAMDYDWEDWNES